MTAEAKVPLTGLATVSASILDAGKYSDLTITCQRRVFKVHKAVVNPQSSFLAACVDGELRFEGLTGKVDLPDDDAKIIAHLIRFLYTGSFDEAPSATDAPADSRLTSCTKFYIIADKYDVPALKELAVTKFQAAIVTEWNTDSLATCINLIFESLPESEDEIRKIAIKAAAQHVKDLVDRDEFVSMYNDDGEIAFDILRHSLPSLASGKQPGQCPNYGAVHANNVSWQPSNRTFYCSGCGHYFT